MNIPELLAPAGTFPIAQAAFDNGADAVYIGIGKFNLRAHSPNFLPSDVDELLDDAHRRGKKVYATLNTMPDDASIVDIVSTLNQLKLGRHRLDAFIVSDPGVVMICREQLPEVPLHLSTQTGTFNSAALRFWKTQGISRVVLPREMSIDSIAKMSAADLVETEIFIHGAMCVSVSGRCLMGAYLDGRHANRGDCSQPCRLRYRISPLNDSGSVCGSFDAEETGQGVYLLNSKDLCTIELIPQLVNSGVNSLKIEGRNKSIHYVASVVKVYREALDLYRDDPLSYNVNDVWRQLLDTVEHRPYTTGFYHGDLQLQEVFTSKASSSARIIGIVKAVLKGGLPVVDVKNSFTTHDTLQVLPVARNSTPQALDILSVTDLEGNPLSYAPSNRLVICHSSFTLKPGDMIRKIAEI
jgi:putative protease